MRVLWRIVRVVFSSVYLALITLVGIPVVLVGTVLAGLVLLPLPATVPVPGSRPISQPTVVYDRNGGVIGTFQSFDRDIPVAEADIPPVLKEAVISDEDKGFYHHGGIDLRGTLRALVADLRSSRVVQGGSTITQQYVKLAYVGSQRNVLRKIREAILASQLDRVASKDEILYRYLTLVYFGDGNYGIGAAAEDYFHVPVSQLTASEAALLAGVIPAPSSRDPVNHPQVAERFRELVLGKMLQQGYLSEAQYSAAMVAKVALATGASAPPPGATLVYPPPPAMAKYPAFVGYVQDWLLGHGYTTDQLASGGLRIQTTLDPTLEDDALADVGATLAGTAPTVDMALASVQPQTGFVVALTGGRGNTSVNDSNLGTAGCDRTGLVTPAVEASADPKATCWDGDLVDNAGGSGSQPGSGWKPFVLATAFEQGIPPTAVYSAPVLLPVSGCKPTPKDPCVVHNDIDGEGGGSLTLAAAMAASVNTVYAQLAPQVGCANVARTAKAMGVDSAYYTTAVFPHCETYALGELDVSPLEMASAYGVFDDHGQRAAPTPILEVVGPTGKVLLDNIHHPPTTTQAIPTNVADNVTSVLQGVLLPGGTAAAHPLGRPAAGKTGTTSNESNAWFTGYTPTLSTSVWLGHTRGVAPLGYVKGIYPVVGGTWPAATWQRFMGQALAGVPPTPFDQPAPITAPTVAGVLGVGSPTTPKPTIAPGPAGYAAPVPEGGPYVLGPASPPVAIPPVTAAPVLPPVPTTSPSASTSAPPSSAPPTSSPP